MDGSEIRYRARQAAQAQWERMGIGMAMREEPAGETGRAWPGRPATGFDAALYTSAADRVMAGRFHLFASRELNPGFPPAWNRDPKSGTEAPLVFGKTMDYRNESLVGDIKYLWELNRHLELVTLAQAWHLTGDLRYAEGAREYLESWFRQCPCPKGPNWTSSLELAIRLLNWSYAWQLLGGDQSPLFEGGRGERFRRAWLESIYLHLRFVRGHLSRHSSSNNHLLGEYTGLFTGATVWPLWRECREWRELAGQALQDEALRQNAEDGVNREQAIWYEHEVADMLLHAGLIGRANGIEFSKEYWTRIAAMLEFISSVMDVAGQVPMIGDADDGVMVRFSQEPGFDVYQSLLATGAVLFGRRDFKAKGRRFDDKTRWLLGDAAAAQFERIPAWLDRNRVRREFPAGGYWILGDKLETPDETRIVADAGPLGFLSIAAHGHADALSLTLSYRGREILVDPGTYAFHTRKKWRDYFRGTSAHNTLRLDGQDQSVPGGNFLWLKHARAECRLFECRDEFEEWEASHDGYLRLPEPVRHRRRIFYDKRAATLEVTDTLDGTGTHTAELFWHFSEGCRVKPVGAGFEIRHQEITVRLQPPEMLDTRLVAGEDSPPLGWISRSFDHKSLTTTLVCKGEVKAPVTLHTRFELESCPPPVKVLDRARRDPGLRRRRELESEES